MIWEGANEFIGRELEIDWLKDAWTQARRGSPQVCVLRGESGFGKTRIVQAFYSWLSSDRAQDPQGYWPDLLLKEGNNLRLNPPPSSFGEIKPLPRLWWGVRWSDPDVHNRGELSTCALIDGLHHLEPHREALLARRQKLKRAGKVAAELGSVTGELLSFGIVGATKSLVEVVQLWREERHMQGREQLSVEERQVTALQAQIDGLYDFLGSVLEPSAINLGGLPLILILDDAHWIDARTLELVGRLLAGARRHRWPFMVIATHWEQDWNLQAQDATRGSFPSLCDRLAADPSQRGAASLSIAVRDIDRLDGLEQLLQDGLPGLTAEQVAFLCGRADGNPRLMNEIILELRDEPSYFEQEDIGRPLSTEALAALSQKSFALHEVQKRRFRRLDEALRKILGYASYQGMRFLRQLVLDVAQVLDTQNAPEDNANRLSRAVHPYAVLAADSAIIYEFRHRVFHDLARERIDSLPQLGRSLSKALLQVAGGWLDRAQVGQLAPAEREAFYLLMLEQPELTDAAFPNLRLRLIAGLFELYDQSGYLAKALDWSDQLEGILPADGRIATEVLSLYDQVSIVYVWLSLDRGMLSKTLARGLVETCRAGLAQSGDSAERLQGVSAAEVVLGDVLLRADQPDKARELFEKALATREHIVTQFGETAERLRDVSVSQERVGDLLLRTDHPDKARELFEKSLATCERIVAEFGETAERLRDVAAVQVRVGDVLRRADQPDQARELFEKSLATRERIMAEFGETVERLRDVSVSQNLVGDALPRADQLDNARVLYEKSLATRERIIAEFGETAERLRDVSVSQNLVGDALPRADQLDKARVLYEKSLATRERIMAQFGETAERLSDVSVSQARVGRVLLRTDQQDKAREIFEKSLAISERVVDQFGETALWLRDVSVAQEEVGDALLRADQPDKARVLYEKSLAIRERIVTQFGETAERLSDLGVSLYKLGDLARHCGNLVLARERLTASESHWTRASARLGTTSAQATLDYIRALIAWVEKAEAAAAQPRVQQVRPTQMLSEKVGRNDPCPCGSRKKYKVCHGKRE